MTTTKREDEFDRWVAEHGGLLLRVARAFANSAADRDDLMQDLLVAVWEALPSWRGESRSSTFIYRVAHNRALNWRRASRRYRLRIEQAGAETATAIWPDSGEADERLRCLYQALATLPAVDRSIALLYLDGLSYAEMAEITGLSESNLGVRLTRIRQTLSDRVRERRTA